MRPIYQYLLISSLMASLVACAADDPHRRAKTGIAIGAVTGAVIGNQSSSKNGKVVGAVVGALSGAAVGHYMDKQHQKLKQALAEEQRNQQIAIVRLDDETLRLDIRSDASFAIDSAELTSRIQTSLDTMSKVISDFDSTAVHIIGHTDSTGTHSHNQSLSVKRARSVASHLAANGVVERRMRTSGRGETQPRFDNTDKAGRRLNRRVEVFLKTIVEGREADAFRPPA